MEIKTNNVPRDIIYGWELNAKEREDFDYLDWDCEDSLTHQFARYKGEIYDLSEFSAVDPAHLISNTFTGWNGYLTESFFSGILIRYTDDWEAVVFGRYCC